MFKLETLIGTMLCNIANTDNFKLLIVITNSNF